MEEMQRDLAELKARVEALSVFLERTLRSLDEEHREETSNEPLIDFDAYLRRMKSAATETDLEMREHMLEQAKACLWSVYVLQGGSGEEVQTRQQKYAAPSEIGGIKK